MTGEVLEGELIMPDVTALGELLIDFTQNGFSEQGNPLFEANPGGAPCNVLAMLSKLGHQTAFMGKVGNDYLGNMLKHKVSSLGIDTGCLYADNAVHTTLAFVHTAEDGDRDFSFYRNPGADMMLREDEVDEELIRNSKIFHFGSLSMTHEGVRKATKRALDIAKRNHILISFDPNLREPLWDTPENARKQITYGMRQCQILKISDNEIQWYTGKSDYCEAAETLYREFQIPLILVSMGKEGSLAYYHGVIVKVPAILLDNTIETTGAGDTFAACVLNYILRNGLEQLSTEQLTEMLLFANAAAALVTTKKGALCVMPEKAEVEEILWQKLQVSIKNI